MNSLKRKRTQLTRRKHRVRKKVFGTEARPRLTVTRTLNHIYAQIIDDDRGATLCAASTLDKELQGAIKAGGNKSAATAVGKLLADRAKAKGVTQVAFDRNGRHFHGRIKALAEAVREGGLQV
jgi:large subunit ribosomal protein L18